MRFEDEVFIALTDFGAFNSDLPENVSKVPGPVRQLRR